jgi:hypothetical protein
MSISLSLPRQFGLRYRSARVYARSPATACWLPVRSSSPRTWFREIGCGAILGLAKTCWLLLTRCARPSPLGFVWHYGLRWRAPESGDDPLVLDALAMGELIHLTLDRAPRTLAASGGLAATTAQQIAGAVDGAAGEVAEFWESERPVPPRVIWRRTLDEARELGRRALAFGNEHLPGTFNEVPFGGAEPKTDVALPWDATASVGIPSTDLAS